MPTVRWARPGGRLAPSAQQVAVSQALELLAYDLLLDNETPQAQHQLAVVVMAWDLEGMSPDCLGNGGPLRQDEWLARRARAMYRRHRAPLRRRAEGLLLGLYALADLGVYGYVQPMRARHALWLQTQDVA